MGTYSRIIIAETVEAVRIDDSPQCESELREMFKKDHGKYLVRDKHGDLTIIDSYDFEDEYKLTN